MQPPQFIPVYPVPTGTPVVPNNSFQQFDPPLSPPPPPVHFIPPNLDSGLAFWTPLLPTACVPSVNDFTEGADQYSLR